MLKQIFLFLSLFLCGCSSVNKRLHLEDDNVFEELIEFEIKKKTGIDIDLTPGNKLNLCNKLLHN